MQLQFCDKCHRPLSEGCIARGEAVQRGSELVCSQCVAREPAPAPVKKTKTAGLAGYEGATWNCEGCGIPVNAMDLIEGRATRLAGMLQCSRCAAVQPARAPAAQPEVAPQPQAAASRRMPLKVSRPSADRFVQEVKREERRPVLPIVLFAVVLPMFAVSVYFAISYQFKLGEALAGRNAAENAPDKRLERPFDMLEPATGGEAEPASKVPVEPPKAPEPLQMTPEVARELAEIEQQLANPVIMQLQSKELPDVWEGLISAGSRRYIATRPFVRRLLREPDDNTRALACRVCALLDDKEALPELDRMAESDPSEDVRIEARKAKGRLTGEATREIEDMSSEELEKYARELQKEIERRKAGND